MDWELVGSYAFLSIAIIFFVTVVWRKWSQVSTDPGFYYVLTLFKNSLVANYHQRNFSNEYRNLIAAKKSFHESQKLVSAEKLNFFSASNDYVLKVKQI